MAPPNPPLPANDIPPRTSVTPGGTFSLRSSFTCYSRNIIYTIVCKRCSMCYIGQTGRRLRDRCREHLYDITTEKLTSVSIHFCQADHRGQEDLAITAILAGPATQSERESLENRLIFQFNTMHPLGMNNLLMFS